jgi:O-methyltransferase
MIHQTKQALQRLIRRFGFDLIRYSPEANGYPPDFTAEQIATIEAVAEYTMTTAERIVALIDAVRYIVSNGIGGDFVECGVWRGGSMMAVARTLLTLDAGDRHLYLYDTFEGMTEPGAVDVNYRGEDAREQFQKLKIDDTSCDWCFASIDDVRRAMASTGYDMEKVHFVKGPVEATVPDNAPERIALLRLDTDWYESTRHELIHFYPRLVRGGVLLLDDYGYWEGARKAVDEYVKENRLSLLLNRIDCTGRVAVKL